MKRTHEGTALTDLILEVFRLNGRLLETGDRLTAALGLTSARWQVLGAIENEGCPVTVAQIGRRIGLSRQNVQRIVNDLERHGFVDFEPNPDHKRARYLAMTERCVASLAELEAIQARWVNELANELDGEALQRITQRFQRIRNAVKRSKPGTDRPDTKEE